MDEILRKILPDIPENNPGNENYVLIKSVVRNKNKTNIYFNYPTISLLTGAIDKFEEINRLALNYNSRVGIATFVNNVVLKENAPNKIEFKSEQVSRIQCLVCEVPVNSAGYITEEEALEAIDISLKIIGISDFIIINNNNLFQVVVLLNESLNHNNWLSLAVMWKNALLKTNLKIMSTSCMDPLLKLWIPGTTNKTLEVPGTSISLDWPKNTKNYDIDYLKDVFSILSLKPKESTVIDFEIMDFTEYAEKTQGKYEFEEITSKCKQLDEISKIEHLTDEILYATVGITSFCKNKDTLPYNLFTKNKRLELKLNQIKLIGITNPTSCETFNELIPNKCSGCKFKDKIKTPLKLVLGEHSLPMEFPTDTPRLPKGYIIKNNKLFRVLPATGEELKIFDYIGYLDDMGMEVHAVNPATYFQFMFKIPHHGWIPLRFEAQMIYSKGGKDSVIDKCVNAGIFMMEHEIKLVKDYLLACAKDRQDQNKHPAKIISQFGWDNNETQFNIGRLSLTSLLDNKTIPKDDAIAQLAKAYSVKGTLDEWRQVTEYLAYDSMKFHAFGLFLGFGAPLCKFAGLAGAMVNLYSELPGTGKSTTGTLINSIYGDPKDLSFTAQDTEISTFIKMGIINNLPIYIDEISEWDGQRVSNFLYFSSGGKEKARATQDSSLKNVRTWTTIVITSSNKSVLDKLQLHTMSSDAQQSRFLEIPIEATEHIDKYGKIVNVQINNNQYGTAGAIYLKELVKMSSSGRLRKDILEARELYEKSFSFSFLGNERFIANTICCAWAGAIYAQKLNLISEKIEISNVFAHVNRIVLHKRRKKLEEDISPLEIINQFVLTNQSSFVKVQYYDMSHMAEGTCPDDAIVGRLELKFRNRHSETPYKGILSVSYEEFRTFCRIHHHPFNAIIDGIQKERLNYSINSIILTAGLGKTLKGSLPPRLRTKAFSVDLPDELLLSYQIKQPFVEETEDGFSN